MEAPKHAAEVAKLNDEIKTLQQDLGKSQKSLKETEVQACVLAIFSGLVLIQQKEITAKLKDQHAADVKKMQRETEKTQQLFNQKIATLNDTAKLNAATQLSAAKEESNKLQSELEKERLRYSDAQKELTAMKQKVEKNDADISRLHAEVGLAQEKSGKEIQILQSELQTAKVWFEEACSVAA